MKPKGIIRQEIIKCPRCGKNAKLTKIRGYPNVTDGQTTFCVHCMYSDLKQ